MFDSHGHLIVPTAIIGGGAYGTVYIAKRYNAAISSLVCDYLHQGYADPKTQKGNRNRADNQKEGSDEKGMCTDTLPPSTRPTKRDNTEGVAKVVESGTLRPNDVPTHGIKERIAKAANSSERALRGQADDTAPPYILVAVKEVTFDLLPDDLDDVLKEVSFMRGMCHENIIGYISSFLHGGTYGGGVPRRDARRVRRFSPQTSARDGGANADEKDDGATRFESASPLSKAAAGTPPPSKIAAIEVSLSSVALKPTRDMEVLAKRAMKELGVSGSQVGKGTWDKTLKQKLLPSSEYFYSSSTGGGSDTSKGAGGRRPAAETFSPLPSMCVVEELADGPSLSELIRIRQTKDDSDTAGKSGVNAERNGGSLLGPLSSTELAAVLHHTLRALDYLHAEARIVHRDVKCANIALDARSGTAKLLDFGTCGAIDNPNVTRHTVLGTPGWIAPEVLAGGVVSTSDGMGARLGYGFRSDLWSFGVTVLELTFLRDARAAQSDPFFAKAIKFLSQMQCSASEEMRAALENEATSRGARGSGGPKGELTHFIIPPPSAASPFAFQSNEQLFTPLLQDLIACCLRRNPALRPSAAELLRHPYFAETLGGGDSQSVERTIDTKNIIKDLVRQAVVVCEAANSSAASKRTMPAGSQAESEVKKNKGAERAPPLFSRPSLCDHASTVSPTALGVASGYGGTALRAPYPMQFLEMFTHTYSEAATLQRLNEANAAASMAVLKDVLVPAARAAPAMAMEIQQKFKTAIALQSGVPLASFTPSSPPYTPSPPCPTEGVPSSSLAPPPPLTRGGILPPEIQAQLQHLALGYHAEDPERHRRATVLMEQHVELLYKIESKLPGFAEKFAAKFVELLVTEHPEGGDVVANALQMMSRLRSDVLKPEMLPSFDPTGDSIEATTDPSKEQKPPIIIKMPSSPAVLDTAASSSPSLNNKKESKGDKDDGEMPIDPTAFLFNQIVDHYATSGAAGGVGLAGGPSQQHVSRFAGLL